MSCPNQHVNGPTYDPRHPSDIAVEVLTALKNGKRIEYLNPQTGKWVPRKKNQGLPNFARHQYRVMVEPATFYALVNEDGTLSAMPTTEIPSEIPEGTKLIELRENMNSVSIRQHQSRVTLQRTREHINSIALQGGFAPPMF